MPATLPPRARMLALVLVLGTAMVPARAQSPSAAPSAVADPSPIQLARHHFFSGRYDEAIEIAGGLRDSQTNALAALEVRTSAIHFKINRLLGGAENKSKALKACEPCPALQAEFLKDIAAGRALAKARLKAAPNDLEARFYEGKLDLNYIWLQLATLGKRTGWGEYWNARGAMDDVLKKDPANVRARVARAWISYIVDTRVPFGMQWMLGGGDRKKALKDIREAAATRADFFVHAEAEFALWEMLARDKKPDEAVEVARRLIQLFPDNQELQRYIQLRAEGKGQRAEGGQREEGKR